MKRKYSKTLTATPEGVVIKTDNSVIDMTKNEAKIMERINYWKKLISESYEQEFRGDARKDNICWEAMEKIGCPLYASNMDYTSMKEAMWCLLRDLEKVMQKGA